MGATRAQAGAADALGLARCRTGDGRCGGSVICRTGACRSAGLCAACPGFGATARYLPAPRRYSPGPGTGGGPGRCPGHTGCARAVATRLAGVDARQAHGGGTASIPDRGSGLVVSAPEPAAALAVAAVGAVQNGRDLAALERAGGRHRAGTRRPVLPAVASGGHLDAGGGTGPGPARYRLLNSVRSYALALLRDPAQVAQLQKGYGHYLGCSSGRPFVLQLVEQAAYAD